VQASGSIQITLDGIVRSAEVSDVEIMQDMRNDLFVAEGKAKVDGRNCGRVFSLRAASPAEAIAKLLEIAVSHPTGRETLKGGEQDR